MYALYKAIKPFHLHQIQLIYHYNLGSLAAGKLDQLTGTQAAFTPEEETKYGSFVIPSEQI